MPEGGGNMGDMQMPNGGGNRGDMQMPNGGGNRSDMQMPEGSGNMEKQEMQDTTKPDNTRSDSDSEPESEFQIVTYEATGESETMLIPVGTAVYTASGSKTTFSRLATGDVLELLLEAKENGEEEIIQVQIVE